MTDSPRASEALARRPHRQHVDRTGAREARLARCIDEGALSFVTRILPPIGILNINENGGGRMTEGPRLSYQRFAPEARGRQSSTSSRRGC